MMKVAQNIAELIGHTPLVKLQRLQPEHGAAVYLKLESFNPSGSVKDRAAYNMILEAEKQGKLTKGATIIEPTSGNTGIGLAMNAAARGYKAILIMPDTMTQERINILKAYGAQVVLTPGEEKMPGCIRKAEELAAQIPNSFIPMQFDNGANPDAHRGTTAVEIMDAVQQIGQPLAAFVATAGTGGTITGTGEELKKAFPELTIRVAEPKGSPVLSGGKPGKHKLVGTSPGFIPQILNEQVYDEIVQVSDEDAYDITRKLARLEGILVGPSSGAACYAAIEAAKQMPKDHIVICMTADTGERYLSSDVFQD
ncbi:cysteine synthase A [Bacillus altitudinis MN12]|uniref:cysteine synthase A n=2 Tax=Bacillaceae TaxID=186817 RepID=UPI0007655E3A|nr:MULTISPECIES: cysteine synthase A [Bacillus]MBY0185329.1 cysteine synthase A [Bacillus aerophilus]MCA1016798.1 cysteine synthase A [Bacillus stratosphericus]CVM40216.1 cysteine synthase A [Streptococcus pneumoniae]KAJ0073206.1 cysteine synthase A [Bacillus altitudinis]MBR0582459.1 cysteine synthase A [Bacillus altitudinis MN12]